MVLGQLHPRKVAPPPPNLKTNPNPNPYRIQFSSGEVVRIPVFIHKITQLNENKNVFHRYGRIRPTSRYGHIYSN